MGFPLLLCSNLMTHLGISCSPKTAFVINDSLQSSVYRQTLHSFEGKIAWFYQDTSKSSYKSVSKASFIFSLLAALTPISNDSTKVVVWTNAVPVSHRKPNQVPCAISKLCREVGDNVADIAEKGIEEGCAWRVFKWYWSWDAVCSYR